MKQKLSSRRRRDSTKSILRLSDLEHAQAVVLNSLNSVDAKRGYRYAIDEYVDWYSSEPRLAFNRIVSWTQAAKLTRKMCYGRFSIRPHRLSMDAYLLGSPRK